MKKIRYYIQTVFTALIMMLPVIVNASEIEESTTKNGYISDKVGFCVDYLGSASVKGTIASTLNMVFFIIKIAAIIIFIITTMFDFAGVITSDKSEMKPVMQKTSKRVVIMLLIFLLPTLIEVVFGIFGYKNVLCGIR